MKKSFPAFIALFIVIIFAVCLIAEAQEIPGIQYQLNSESIEQAKSNGEIRVDHLKQEWQKILLNKKMVSVIDSLLQKLSPFFIALFNKPYELLSLSLWIIVILWVFFFFFFSEFLKDYSSFKPVISYSIGLIMSVVLAHINLLQKIADYLIFLVIADKPWWVKSLFIIAILGAMIGIYFVEKKYGKVIAENRKKMKLLQKEMEIASGVEASKNLSKALKEIANEP